MITNGPHGPRRRRPTDELSPPPRSARQPGSPFGAERRFPWPACVTAILIIGVNVLVVSGFR